MKIYFIFALLTALVLGACNNKPVSNNNETATDTTANTGKVDTSSKMDTTAPTVAVMSDTEFLTTAYNIGLFEISISKLALKSGDSRLREFADMIISDHTAMNRNIKALLVKKKYAVPVMLPADLMDKAKELSELKGNDFAKKYATINVNGHKAAILLFTQISFKGKDADVRQLAASEIPTLQKHEDHAQKLLAEVTTPKL